MDHELDYSSNSCQVIQRDHHSFALSEALTLVAPTLPPLDPPEEYWHKGLMFPEESTGIIPGWRKGAGRSFWIYRVYYTAAAFRPQITPMELTVL